MNTPSSKFQKILQNRVNIAQAVATTPPPQKYIVGHLPDEPGIYGLIIGPDASRKSWLALHIALSVACGRPVAQGVDSSFLWPAPTPGRVVYLSSEDSHRALTHRIWSLSCLPGHEWVGDAEESMDLIPTYSGLAILSLDGDGKPIPTPEYKDLVDYAAGARLIILDPLSDLLDIGESDDRAARGAVQILRDLSLKTGAGVLGIHHQNKNSMLNGEKHHQSGRGSSRFGAGCRWAVVLQPMTAGEGDKNQIGLIEDWTSVHEGKASYSDTLNKDKWLKRHIIGYEEDGNIFTSAPASAVLEKESLKEIIEKGKKSYRKKGSGEPDEHEQGGKSVGPDYDWK